MAVSASFGVPITPIYGFGAKRWKGYEDLSGVYTQYVPPAMEPGVVVSMAKLIPQPQQVLVSNGGFGYVRYSKIGPFFEPPVVRRMARDLDVPMMAGAFGVEDDKPTLKDALISVAISGVVLVVGVSAVFWFVREMARG